MNSGGHPLTIDDELVARPANMNLGNLRKLDKLSFDWKVGSRVCMIQLVPNIRVSELYQVILRVVSMIA